jgi:hypothetical protein
MKRNTRSDCNDQGKYFPQHVCDKAQAKTIECFNESFSPIADVQKFPVFDIPVVLAEVELQADVEVDIKLPTPAREIKWTRKNVSLKQCKAIPSIQRPGFVKLFITGVLHKNFQYVEDCSGYVKDYSVDVPFSCIQQVQVFNRVIEFPSQKASVDERIFLDKKGHGADQLTAGSVTFEFYNEPIECKLLFSAVNELDIYKKFDRFGHFEKVTEKIEINLGFKLLQNQQFNPKLFQPKPKPFAFACKPVLPVHKTTQSTTEKTARERFLENINGMYRIR